MIAKSRMKEIMKAAEAVNNGECKTHDHLDAKGEPSGVAVIDRFENTLEWIFVKPEEVKALLDLTQESEDEEMKWYL